jgi:hypothetical protein
MNTPTDQTLARRLLQVRQQGYSFGLFYRFNLRRYLLMIAIFGTLMTNLALAEAWRTFCTMLGLFVGTVVRDVAWMVTIRKSWPFTERITDWNKVQRLANEPLLDDPTAKTH